MTEWQAIFWPDGGKREVEYFSDFNKARDSILDKMQTRRGTYSILEVAIEENGQK